MIDEVAQANLDFWSERMGIRQKIKFKRVPRTHWDGNNGRHLWGIAPDGTFLYSKTPSEETIVHECAHLRWPRFSEEEVRQVTRALLW